MNQAIPALLFAAAASASAATSPAIPQDPTAAPSHTEAVLVVGAKDGLPRPGAIVHVRDVGAARVQIDEQGYLIAEDQQVRSLRNVNRARTDPEGRASLTVARPLKDWQLVVEPPFRSVGKPKRDDDHWLIRVTATRALGVRVFDTDDRPVADLAVAMHAGGKDIAIAITDDTGRAVLGIPDDFSARAVLAPAGWVGPKDGFPSIARSLEGHSGVRLKLPPYGSLCLRRVRGGIPEPGTVRATTFRDPSGAPLSSRIHASAPNANGVVYPYVALGVELHAYPQPAKPAPLQCRGPTRAGGRRTVDIDLGAIIRLQCEGLAAGLRTRPATVRLVTDETEVKRYVTRERNGSYRIELGRSLAGTRIVRVDVDVDRFSGWKPCDAGLRAKAIDLGTVTLAETTPQLRGRVLDGAGQPAPNVRVAISASERRSTGHVKVTDEDGRFTSSSPVLRNERGEPLQLFARVVSRGYVSESVQAVDGIVTLRLQPRPESEHAPIASDGTVTVRVLDVRDARDGSDVRHGFQLIGEHSVGRLPKFSPLPGGGIEVTFYKLRAGTYRLLAPAPEHRRFVVLEDLQVPGNGPCEDPRLDGLNCAEHLRSSTVRVVDDQDVPIAGASITVPGGRYQTDGTGSAKIYLGRTTTTEATITAPGRRAQRCTEWPGDVTVRLLAASKIEVEIRGLPDDLPRDKLEIWLREDVRGSFVGPRRMLGTGNPVELQLPARGDYRLWLLVTHRRPNGGSSSSAIKVGTDVVAITANEDRRVVLELDAEDVARIRTQLGKKK